MYIGKIVAATLRAVALALIAVSVLAGAFIVSIQDGRAAQLKSIKQGEFVRLSSIFQSEWEQAYVIDWTYASKESVAEKLSIDMREFDLNQMNSDNSCIIFASDGICVEVFEFSWARDLSFGPRGVYIERANDLMQCIRRDEISEFQLVYY